MIHVLQNSSDFTNELKECDLVLVDFYADWCEPCKWLDKILEEVKSSADFQFKILKVNTDKHLDLTHEFHLRSVPVLMIFKNGEIMWRVNGFLMANELLEKLREFSRET